MEGYGKIVEILGKDICILFELFKKWILVWKVNPQKLIAYLEKIEEKDLV